MPKEGTNWTPEHRENFKKAMEAKKAAKEKEEKEFKGTPEQREKWRKDSQERRDAKKEWKKNPVPKKTAEFPISAISDGREDRVAGVAATTRQYIKKANGSDEDKRLYIAAKLLDTIDFILKGK